MGGGLLQLCPPMAEPPHACAGAQTGSHPAHVYLCMCVTQPTHPLLPCRSRGPADGDGSDTDARAHSECRKGQHGLAGAWPSNLCRFAKRIMPPHAPRHVPRTCPSAMPAGLSRDSGHASGAVRGHGGNCKPFLGQGRGGIVAYVSQLGRGSDMSDTAPAQWFD